MGDAPRQHAQALEFLCLAERLLGMPGLGHIAGGAHQAVDAPLRIADGHEEGFRFLARAADVEGPLEVDGGFCLHAARTVRRDRFRQVRLEAVLDPLPPELLAGSAGEGLVGGIGALETEGAVLLHRDPEDGVRGIQVESPEPVLAFPQGLLRLLEIRDVPDGLHGPDDAAPFIPQGRGLQPHVYPSPVHGLGGEGLREDGVLLPLKDGIAGCQFRRLVPEQVHELGARPPEERHRVGVVAPSDHVGGGDARQLHDGLVPYRDPPSGVDRQGRIGQVVDDLRQAPFALLQGLPGLAPGRDVLVHEHVPVRPALLVQDGKGRHPDPDLRLPGLRAGRMGIEPELGEGDGSPFPGRSHQGFQLRPPEPGVPPDGFTLGRRGAEQACIGFVHPECPPLPVQQLDGQGDVVDDVRQGAGFPPQLLLDPRLLREVPGDEQAAPGAVRIQEGAGRGFHPSEAAVALAEAAHAPDRLVRLEERAQGRLQACGILRVDEPEFEGRMAEQVPGLVPHAAPRGLAQPAVAPLAIDLADEVVARKT